MLRFIRNLIGFAFFEVLEYVAVLLGLVAVAVFIAVAYVLFNFFSDALPAIVNLVVSCSLALLVALVPGYAAVRIAYLGE